MSEAMIALRFSRWPFAIGLALIVASACSGSHPVVPLANEVTTRSGVPLAVHGYKLLYSFKGGIDGEQPQSDLVFTNGKLYGTTIAGGKCSSSQGCGTAFDLSLGGSERVLHRFASSTNDGAYPYAGLVAVKGKLYGTTSGGGAFPPHGTVYEITVSGQEQVIHSFSGSGDGNFPTADLLEVNGALFGTTRYGGSGGNCYSGTCGTVFDVTTSGKEHVVYSFKASQPPKDGAWPYDGVTSVNGTLYGATNLGGTHGVGTVFQVSRSGKERIIYSFQGHHDGAYPNGPLVLLKGKLYGTTSVGGAYGFGTVFAVTTSGKESLIYVFKGGPTDGNGPSGRLVVVNGNFYGATYSGGSTVCFSKGYHCGTVFEVSPTGKETVLYNFKGGNDGAAPSAGLTAVSGALYGTTYYGGSGQCFSLSQGIGGCGTVFEISP
jgi:uncharacterized repeat protein (TIGR03803 family)